MPGFQYQPNQVDRTFAATTRQEIVTAFESALASGVPNAGWTIISGGGTADVKMESQAGAPSGLKMRLRARDTGSGNSAQISVMDVTETYVSQAFFLLPGAAQNIRIVAGGYQVCALFPGDTSARKFFMCGVPYLEPFLVTYGITQSIWAHANSNSDTDVTTRNSFRTLPSLTDGGTTTAWQLFMGNAWGGNGAAIGQRLIAPAGLFTQNPNNSYGRFFVDGSAMKTPPYIAWARVTGEDDSYIMGLLWGAALISDTAPAEDPSSFDGHTWINVMVYQTASTTNRRSSLYLATN